MRFKKWGQYPYQHPERTQTLSAYQQAVLLDLYSRPFLKRPDRVRGGFHYGQGDWMPALRPDICSQPIRLSALFSGRRPYMSSYSCPVIRDHSTAPESLPVLH